ncbi:MAG: biopolymer transporter ExbD [Akkermansiaceae bacterium]
MEFHRIARKPTTVSIVSLIDILVTLLFFFIVTMKDSDDFEKKKLKPEIQVSLPSAHSMKVTTTKQTRSTLSLGKDGRAELDGTPVVQGLLKEYLIANLKERSGLKLALRVDKECPFEAILRAHSAAIDAGYSEKEIYYLVDKPQSGSIPPSSESP